MNLERRFTEHKVSVESRDADGPPLIVGYGAVFNSISEDLGGFREMIAPGAFDSVLEDDVRALFNHDNNYVLGRTRSGTLKLSVDDIGLRYEAIPPATQIIQEMVVAPMKRGDIDQSSFGFIVAKDDWNENLAGEVTRTIMKVERLFDVSPVTFPAYPDTNVAMRKFEAMSKDAGVAISDNDVIAMIISAGKIIKGSSNANTKALQTVLDKALHEIKELRMGHERQKVAIELFRRLSTNR